jgi:hypothetical protein
MIIRGIRIAESRDPAKKGLREIQVSDLGIDLPPDSWRPIYVSSDTADIEVDDLTILKMILKRLNDIENRLAKAGL